MNSRKSAALDRHITGNYGEDQFDAAWEHLHDNIAEDCNKHGLTDMDAFCVWKMGLATYQQLRALGVRLPHDSAD